MGNLLASPYVIVHLKIILPKEPIFFSCVCHHLFNSCFLPFIFATIFLFSFSFLCCLYHHFLFSVAFPHCSCPHFFIFYFFLFFYFYHYLFIFFAFPVSLLSCFCYHLLFLVSLSPIIKTTTYNILFLLFTTLLIIYL